MDLVIGDHGTWREMIGITVPQNWLGDNIIRVYFSHHGSSEPEFKRIHRNRNYEGNQKLKEENKKHSVAIYPIKAI